MMMICPSVICSCHLLGCVCDQIRTYCTPYIVGNSSIPSVLGLIIVSFWCSLSRISHLRIVHIRDVYSALAVMALWHRMNIIFTFSVPSILDVGLVVSYLLSLGLVPLPIGIAPFSEVVASFSGVPVRAF
jgi:hypothetical protein